jgi:hypothetical protein
MTATRKPQPNSPELLGAEQAIKRASLRAREIARQTHTPCIVRRDGKLIDIAGDSTKKR